MDRQALQGKVAFRVRFLRLEKGFTQKTLAHHIGKEQQVIQRLEAGRTNPTLLFLYEISVALGVSIRDLLDDPEL